MNHLKGVFFVRSPRRFQRRNAMTFVELLVVVTVISFLSLAVYNAFSHGVEIWQRSKRVVREEDVVIFFDKLTADAHNVVRFFAFPFDGDQSRVVFPGIVMTSADPLSAVAAGEQVEQIGRIEYAFLPEENAIVRRQADYGQAGAGAWGPARVLAHDIVSLRFSYVYATDTGEVIRDQPFAAAPTYLEVTVTFSDGVIIQKMQKVIPFFIMG